MVQYGHTGLIWLHQQQKKYLRITDYKIKEKFTALVASCCKNVLYEGTTQNQKHHSLLQRKGLSGDLFFYIYRNVDWNQEGPLLARQNKAKVATCVLHLHKMCLISLSREIVFSVDLDQKISLLLLLLLCLSSFRRALKMRQKSFVTIGLDTFNGCDVLLSAFHRRFHVVSKL